jgi:hypothetical protein
MTIITGFFTIIAKSQPYISTLVCIEDFEDMSIVGSGVTACSVPVDFANNAKQHKWETCTVIVPV